MNALDVWIAHIIEESAEKFVKASFLENIAYRAGYVASIE